MERAELAKRQERARTETFVIRQIEDGFQIYVPERPDRRYLVSGDRESPSCTCPDYETHTHDPEWRCKHILAVFNQAGNGSAAVTATSTRRNGSGAIRTGVSGSAQAGQMVLKRSVSPDGRIDSLSVEFACPVDPEVVPAVKALAARTLRLQSEIVGGFLNGGNRRNGNRPQAEHAGNGPLPAELVGIGGIDTRFGRRLFINVHVDGKVLKLFGTEKRLAEAISGAGFPEAAEYVEEGIQLNLPCRVTTKPSDDGRYLNVDAVFPTAENERAR